MTVPRVSVLIGAYDNAVTLARAVDAILAQTVTDLELIAIDDGSRDATPQVSAAAPAATSGCARCRWAATWGSR